MVARSPASGALSPGRSGRQDGEPGVLVAERPFLAAASVSLRAGRREALAGRVAERFGLALPLRPAFVRAGTVSLVWSGPSHWLAFDEARQDVDRFGFATALADAVGDAASVTELTGARTVFRLRGPAVREALGRLVPIDLDPSVFTPGAAALTLAGHVGVTLWRLPDEVLGFEICCYRSFAGSLAQALLEAGRSCGCLVSAAA